MISLGKGMAALSTAMRNTTPGHSMTSYIHSAESSSASSIVCSMPNSSGQTSRPAEGYPRQYIGRGEEGPSVDTGGGAANDAVEMEAGKLPNELLARLLATVTAGDPRIVVGPGVGRDAAVIDAGGERLLIAKSDPVTFASDHIGWYATHVNANDVACMGGRPAWFLATILLPEGATEALASDVFGQVRDACAALEIELVGGHTEITLGLGRPIVVGAMLGEVERESLVEPGGAREGDALLLTKGIAIEGTAVLAREAGERLSALGVGAATVAAAREYIFAPGISVVRDGLAVREALGPGRVHAMHDPTEGGLATALYELAQASGLGIAVDGAAIEVLPETRAICEAASLEPLGLLASGALLIAVAAEDADTALSALESGGIRGRRIGRMVNNKTGVIMEGDTERRPIPRFTRDEVARFLAS
jgi:hydrogenase expression/formation protein HypE